MQFVARRRPQEQVRPIPEEVLNFRPEAPLRLKKTVFSQCLREAPSGSSFEILLVCMDDGELPVVVHVRRPASPLEQYSDVWWQNAFHGSSFRTSRKFVHPVNSRCRLGLEQFAWVMQSGPRLAHTTTNCGARC